MLNTEGESRMEQPNSGAIWTRKANLGSQDKNLKQKPPSFISPPWALPRNRLRTIDRWLRSSYPGKALNTCTQFPSKRQQGHYVLKPCKMVHQAGQWIQEWEKLSVCPKTASKLVSKSLLWEMTSAWGPEDGQNLGSTQRTGRIIPRRHHEHKHPSCLGT